MTMRRVRFWFTASARPDFSGARSKSSEHADAEVKVRKGRRAPCSTGELDRVGHRHRGLGRDSPPARQMCGERDVEAGLDSDQAILQLEGGVNRDHQLEPAEAKAGV